MKVINFSWDSSALGMDSKFAERIIEYGGLVDRYGCLVPAQSDCRADLSEKAVVYGLGCEQKSFINRLKFLFKLYRFASKLIKTDNYEVISVQDPFELAAVAWLVARKFGLGLVMEEHGDFFSNHFWRDENSINFLRYHLGLFLIKRADSIRTASWRIKRTLTQRFGIDPEKVVAVPIYTEIKERWGTLSYSNLKDRYDGKFVFLTLGRMAKQKNLPLLLAAYKEVAARNDTMLVIVGDGPEKDYLKKLAHDLGLGYKADFNDWTEDVYPWYEAADCYILSSNYEGWGRVIVEATVSGLPIIMTDVGCAGDLIKDGVSGVVVPIGDRQALTAGMLKVMSDEIFRKKISAEARQAVTSLPGREETLNRYWRVWQQARKKIKPVPTI